MSDPALLMWRARIVLIGAVLSVSGCVSREYAYREAVELKGTLAVDQRLSFARNYATPEQRNRLIDELRLSMPGLAADLQGVFVSWSTTKNVSKDTQSVTIIVGIRSHSPIEEIGALRARLKAIVERDVRKAGF